MFLNETDGLTNILQLVDMTPRVTAMSTEDITDAAENLELILPLGVENPYFVDSERSLELVEIRLRSFARLGDAWMQLASL